MAIGRIVSRSQYQGNPMLVYARDEQDRYPVQLGTRKISAVVCNIKQTLKFLTESGGEDGKEAVGEFLKHYHPVVKSEKPKKAKS